MITYEEIIKKMYDLHIAIQQKQSELLEKKQLEEYMELTKIQIELQDIQLSVYETSQKKRTFSFNDENTIKRT